MTKLVVAKRIGVERPATKQEVCRHVWVDCSSSSGRRRHQRCMKCGRSGTRPMGAKESILR